ncbi:ATP-binding protein [Agromyces atrinae]|uniref:ATP-binding protein n=1 Tax=Agromyces atrinae TaxID=592376 RepID=A0A4V1R2F1_9MICO|nr:ATP-binding protein [Agromyces atrinae]NYD67232.1 hypothetical protein [Agromyces atrinae]RXZ86936.1 ATP-binding protein [Agromyces atrinae]
MTAPTARSHDARSFTVSAADRLVAGGLVTLDSDDGVRQLGLIESVDVDARTARGRLLGTLGGDGLASRDMVAFDNAVVGAASSDAADALHRATRAELVIGTNRVAPGGPARLLPTRFNRHTFWCGQSGSGKTYALGVVLEQLIAHTALPVVVFDPNSDFVRLGELRDGVTGETADALADRDIRVLRPQSDDQPLRARFTSLTLSAKEAILQLDPIRDRDEFNTLLHTDAKYSPTGTGPGGTDPHELLTGLYAGGPDQVQLGQRLENLGLLDWEVWAGPRRAATEVIAERPDATVLDLGGFSTPEQQLVVALSVLDELWERREERRPVLLVIDEAHNLCSPDATSELQVALRERLIQIAAEGRKFGLWLLLSTQRPSKIHPGILSQCDNLALMKMSSPVDLEGLATYFGFAPEGMLAASPWFRQGEALFAGGFVPAPTLVQMGERLTPEGGYDVGVPMR